MFLIPYICRIYPTKRVKTVNRKIKLLTFGYHLSSHIQGVSEINVPS